MCSPVVEELRCLPQFQAELVRRIHIEPARIGRYMSLVGDNVVAKFHGRRPRRYIVSRVSQQFALSNFSAQRLETGDTPSFLAVFTQPVLSLDVVQPRFKDPRERCYCFIAQLISRWVAALEFLKAKDEVAPLKYGVFVGALEVAAGRGRDPFSVVRNTLE